MACPHSYAETNITSGIPFSTKTYILLADMAAFYPLCAMLGRTSGTSASPSKKLRESLGEIRGESAAKLMAAVVCVHYRSADDEMTIKCAYHRNCRLLDNDNYKDRHAGRDCPNLRVANKSRNFASAACRDPGLVAYAQESGNSELVFVQPRPHSHEVFL